MRGKVVNAIYLSALFLFLLCLSIPVLPFSIQACALCLFVIYLIVAKIDINVAYKKWTLVYLSFFLLSSLWALSSKLALYVIFVNILPILLITFSTISFIKKNQRINEVLFIIYIVALLMLIYLATHIDEFLIGVRLSTSLNEEGDQPMWNSNGVGINLCFAIFAGFILFINQNRCFLIRIIYCMTAIIMVGAIILTGSRKSLLILLMPVFYFLYKKQKKHFLLMLILTPLVAVLIYEIIMHVEVFYEAVGTRIEDMIAIMTDDTSGNEDTSRVTLIEFGLNKFLDNPILGVGINNFRFLSEEIYPGKNFYAHNNYVELLVDVGIIGFFVYYRAYLYLYSRLKSYTDTISMWCKVFLFVLLFLGFVEVLYYEPLEQLFFCLLFCIVEFNENKILLNGKRIENS